MTLTAHAGGVHTASALDILSCRSALPSPGLANRIRWRRSLQDNGQIWLDQRVDASSVQAAKSGAENRRLSNSAHNAGGPMKHQTTVTPNTGRWCVSGWCQDDIGHRLPVLLFLPVCGIGLETGIDWAVARNILDPVVANSESAVASASRGDTELPGKPLMPAVWPARSQWLRMQAEYFADCLSFSGLTWSEALVETDMARALTDDYSILGYEDPGGGTWRLHAPRQCLSVFWRRTGASIRLVNPTQRLPDRIICRKLPLPLSVDLPALTPQQTNRLQIGSLIRLQTHSLANSKAVRASITPTVGRRPDPFHFHAAIDLLVYENPLSDSIELRWRAFMNPIDLDPSTLMPEPSDTELIHAELSCVVASISLSLEDLMNLQAGDLLPALPVSTPLLELRIGQQRVGAAELVRLGDGLAVQIIEWNLKEETTDETH